MSRAPAAASNSLEYMVPEKEWAPDGPRCNLCGSGFSLGNRRHHCRRCGGCFCHSCSSRKIRLCGLAECRVCVQCARESQLLADFNREHRERMSTNLAIMEGAHSFRRYKDGRAPEVAEVWLSADALLVCVRVGGETAQLEGHPTHLLEEVLAGQQTGELMRRRKKASLCCEQEDAGYVARAPCFFSLAFRDGQTVDLEADSEQAAAQWVRRFRALRTAVVPFAEFKTLRSGARLPALVRKEAVRLRQLHDQVVRAERKSRTRSRDRRKSTAIREKYQRVRESGGQ